VVVPPVSFARGENDTGWANAADPASFVACATGGGRTVGVIVADPNWPKLSCATYRTGVATPEYLVFAGHAAAGAALHGTKETVPLGFTVYTPSFETVRVERLQFVALNGAVAPDGHSFTVGALRDE
jgi:hypothetical protein